MYNFPTTLPTQYNDNYFSSHFFRWNECAGDDIINKIINIGESTETMQAQVGSKNVNLQIRDSIVSWLHYNESNKEIFDFLVDKIDRINYHHYGLQLTGMESLQYTRYPIGGHYKFHNDVIYKKENSMRKLSIVLALSSPDEYEGGELLLSPHGVNPTTIKLNKGELVAFPSYVPHKVNPVISGNRITLVNWVFGPKFT